MNKAELMVKGLHSWLQLQDLFREHDYLENVISRFEFRNVDPLAVNVMSVGIPAAHSDTLLSKVSTFVPLFNACNKK